MLNASKYIGNPMPSPPPFSPSPALLSLGCRCHHRFQLSLARLPTLPCFNSSAAPGGRRRTHGRRRSSTNGCSDGRSANGRPSSTNGRRPAGLRPTAHDGPGPTAGLRWSRRTRRRWLRGRSASGLQRPPTGIRPLMS